MDGRLLNTLNISPVLVRPIMAASLLFAIAGCRAGGGVSNAPVQNTVTVVKIPTIASPLVSPHYSRDDTLRITGMCMTGNSVTISGDASETKTCENSEYFFDVLKIMDGLYTFQIAQTGIDGTKSAAAPLVWVKKTSIAPPTITSPAASPFLSSQSNLSVIGGCETGATITLTGDSGGTTACSNSIFAFNVPKTADGEYTFTLNQTDRAGNSASSLLVWRKFGIAVTPANPSLVVTSSQTLSMSGGSGAYSVSFTSNNSGATYNPGTRVYTAGTLAGVTDVLQVTDTLGASKTVTVTTVPGPVDHLSLPSQSGDAQVKPVGQALDDMLSIKVVDRYENGIPNYQVYFQVVGGDSEVIGNPVRTTNAQGVASVSVRAGQNSTNSEFLVKPATGSLPDLAGTGRTRLTMTQSSTTSGKGPMGTVFSVGSGPTHSAVVDLNGDTYRDLVVLNSGEPSIGIRLGKGNGLYQNMTRITGVCNTPTAMIAASLNSNVDTFLDLAVSCGGSDAIVVYTGRGDGTFNTPATVISTAPNATIPLSITSGDFNKDGRLDLAIASTGGSVVAVYFGNGNGAFAGEQIFNVGTSPNAIAVGDLNKDGNLDLVASNAGDNTISVLNGNGSGSFEPAMTYGSGVGVVSIGISDLNKDGWQDVAVAVNGEDTVAVYLNDLTGLLEAPTTNPVGIGPTSLAILDYDGDGNQDIAAVTSGDSHLSILPGMGNGAFGGAISRVTVLNPSFISFGDVNGDNQNDFAVSGDGKVEIIPVFPSGVVGLAVETGSNPTDTAFARFNNDIYVDMAVINNGANSLQIFTGDGKGRFTLATTLATGVSPVSVKSSDFNHDGYADLVVVNNGNATVRIYLGKGDGTFEAPLDFTTASGPAGVAIQDYDSDGNEDLAVVAVNSNRVSILRGLGDGTFGAKVDYITGSSPSGITAIDLNEDQTLDLVTSNNSSNNVTVLIGNGNGTFRSGVEYPVGNGPTLIVSSDFNNDGVGDVAVLNSTDGTISILRGLGDGSLSVGLEISAGLSPTGIVLGDFNGDTRVDLATGNGPNFGFTVLYGAGNGQFNVSASFASDYPVGNLGAADVNGDYSLDMIVLDNTGSEAHTWLGQ